MRLFVAVTDKKWWRFLADRPHLDEANFCLPAASGHFRALSPSEPFLFKLHSPENYIVGGGFFAHFSRLPLWQAWRVFEEANGTASRKDLRRHVQRHRRNRGGAEEVDQASDATEVGCVMLVDTFYFREPEWIAVPKDWKSATVRGKTYRTETKAGDRLWSEIKNRLEGRLVAAPRPSEQQDLLSDAYITRPRLGRRSFQVAVGDAAGWRCQETGEMRRAALEAAMRVDVEEGGAYEAGNGVLLRADLARLRES